MTLCRKCKNYGWHWERRTQSGYPVCRQPGFTRFDQIDGIPIGAPVEQVRERFGECKFWEQKPVARWWRRFLAWCKAEEA
jgi:hypothetical protein